ncbi:fumarylacetoacetate hydrolase family protein [Ramlibacter sp.]|uniref:fumarylacetoacetate hydrolase family protein n=1 Tax=Ramlibacter sp. TaxID=1917967 RepID=UPI002607F56C|nr:fumarylacetoacetate hydrolase family protein [Ramlibacter sp.]
MKFLSYRRDGADRIGAVRGDQVVDLTDVTQLCNLGEALRKVGPEQLRKLAGQGSATLALAAVDTYRPVVADAERIVCVGLNYEEHRVEAGRAKTAYPSVFLRLPSSQVGHLQPIVVPPRTARGP